jgi:hypothetical protein
MNRILFKLRFYNEDELELKMSRDKFVDMLQNNMDPKKERMHYGSQKMTFNRSRNDYNGLIAGNEFELNQNFYAFDGKYNYSTIHGRIIEFQDNILIKLSANSVKGREIIFLIVGILIFLIGLIRLFLIENYETEDYIMPFAGIGTLIFTRFYCSNDAQKTIDKVQRDLIKLKNKAAANNGEHAGPQ